MKMKYIFTLPILALTLFTTCTNPSQENKEFTAQEIVDKAIEVAGGQYIVNAEIEFDFRNRHYKSIRNGGEFQYERIFKDSLDIVRDVLNNDGFERYINDTVATLTPDSMKVKYANSVNSVLYFALLPYGLNDPATIKKRLDGVTIDGKEYHKVQISFQQEGGGKDYEDVFVYWIEREKFTVDYFGYTYITDGGGARFRKAYNHRMVNNIRFSDYVNYKPKENRLDVESFDIALLNDELKELSRIELDNISVKLLE